MLTLLVMVSLFNIFACLIKLELSNEMLFYSADHCRKDK